MAVDRDRMIAAFDSWELVIKNIFEDLYIILNPELIDGKAHVDEEWVIGLMQKWREYKVTNNIHDITARSGAQYSPYSALVNFLKAQQLQNTGIDALLNDRQVVNHNKLHHSLLLLVERCFERPNKRPGLQV